MSHSAATMVAVQLSMPSLTVTSPVGVPRLRLYDATSKWIVTVWPTVEGSGVSEVILVVVSARLTWCVTLSDGGLGLW